MIGGADQSTERNKKMREELEQKLADEFPFMRKNENFQTETGYVHDLYGAFGMECGDGWYDVIRGLCLDITDIYKKRNLKVAVKPLQIKEKYGSLRFYCDIDAENDVEMDKELLDEICNEVFEAVSKWEDVSERTCELCGKDGERRGFGWVTTRCEECHQKALERNGE